MISAFGVDHGLVSKGVARGPGGLPRSRKLIALGRGSRKVYDKAKRGAHKVVTTELSLQNLGRGTGKTFEAAGRGTGKIGRGLGKHPAVTGTAVAGGAAGYGGYKYHEARQKPPKTKKKAAPSAPEAM